MSMNCSLCPRNCGADRNTEIGYCAMPWEPVVARAARHDWEEPCISGTSGAGAVFFSGCNLRCVFCQNYDISARRQGQKLTVDELRALFRKLEAEGVHNLDLVTPTHFALAVRKALDPPPSIPVVWNSGGYDKLITLKMLAGKIQIYMPDLKYSDPALAARLSGAPDYPQVAQAAILEMFRQVGPYVLDDEGVMRSGVLIRHLVLPGELDNSFGVLDWIADTFRPGDVMVSLMSQYTPNGYGGPDRRLTAEEYERVVAYMRALGILDGYTQEPSSAESAYTPAFDGTGLETILGERA